MNKSFKELAPCKATRIYNRLKEQFEPENIFRSLKSHSKTEFAFRDDYSDDEYEQGSDFCIKPFTFYR